MSKITIRHNLDFNYKFFSLVALIFQDKAIKMNSKSIAYWARWLRRLFLLQLESLFFFTEL